MDRQINILITKILNWTDPNGGISFQLSFYSLKAGSKIIQKMVKAQRTNNELLLNCALKINYSDDENTVILRLSRVNTKGPELLGEFTINLDLLNEREIQFYPFGRNDRILQINLYDYKQTKNDQQQVLKNNLQRNDEFIRDKQHYLHHVITNSRMQGASSLSYAPRTLKKSFSEKVYNMLREIKHMKSFNGSRQSNVNLPTESRLANHCENRSRCVLQSGKRMLEKCRSQNAMKYIPPRQNCRQNQSKQDEVSNKDSKCDYQSLKSKKHRLILKNLNVVPCEEYFETGTMDIEEPKQATQTPKTAPIKGKPVDERKPAAKHYQSRFV